MNPLHLVVPDLTSVEKLEVRLSGDTAYTTALVNLENKGWFRITLDSIYYQISWDLEQVLDKKSPLLIRLAPGEDTLLRIPLSVPYITIRKKIKSMNPIDSFDLKLDARLFYSTRLGKPDFAFQKTFRLKAPVPPEINIVETRFISFKKGVINLEADVQVNYHGEVDVKLSDLKIGVNIEDLMRSDVAYGKDIVLKKEGGKKVTLPVSIRVKKPLRLISDVLKKNKLQKYNLTISGQLWLNGQDQAIPVNIRKNGKIDLKKRITQ
jgi:LEA14-like dessication related protein